MKPLLSICVPTYNRSLWLRSSLWNWLPQIERYHDSVELVVSNDASTDDTDNIINEARAWGAFRYNKNDTNIGMFTNYAKLVDLAAGEYVWMVGDDAVPRSEAIKRSTEALKLYPGVDAVCVNYNCWSPKEPPKEPLLTDRFGSSGVMISKLNDEYLKKLGDIIEYDPSYLGFANALIWKRSAAKDAFPKVAHEKYHTSLETSIPHAAYAARYLSQKPAYYIGQPLLVNSVTIEAFSWANHFIITHVHWLQELGEEFIRSGVPESSISKRKREHLINSENAIWEILNNKKTPRREAFSLWRFIQRNWRYPELYMLFIKMAKKRVFCRMGNP